MKKFSGKRRPSVSLSLFATLSESFSSEKSPNSTKYPRNFEGGVVGLGIVAAMTDLGNAQDPCVLVSPRSSPIPIVLAAKPAANFRPNLNKHELDELSESYTCVISHFGHNLIKKRVYFDDKIDGVGGCNTSCVVDCGVFSTSPVSFGEVGGEFWSEDFLSSCYLCKKKLYGLDIFMYRGEKAFCSTDCRDKQIRSDDHKENCGSEAIKPLDYSASPSSGPMPCFAGVAAA